MADVHRLSKDDPKVVYMGPANGPFRCGRCKFFHKPHDCEKVSGKIDMGGCCNLFKPKGGGSGTTYSS